MAATYRRWEQDTFDAYCKRFGLPEKTAFKDYSRGMKMKLTIAAALSHQARLLVLDEATAGLDPLAREEALDKLCHSYSGYFDVVRHEEPKGYLVAEAGLHIHSEKYVLVKAAKLWEADNNEYVYIFSAPVLTKEIFEQCREQARADGMQRIEPGPNHMCSYITAIFLCDTCEPDALRALRRTRIYKSFKLAFHGWMDYHTGVVELSTGKTAANGSGRSTAQLLKTTLFKNMKEGS